MLSADYTMCLHDVLVLDPNLFDFVEMDTTEHSQKLIDMIKAKWNIYEISGETIPEFKLFMVNKFNQYKDYYIEKINAYEIQIRWLDGEINKDTYNLTEESDENYTPQVEYTTTDTPGVTMTDEHYDLPRSSSTENRPSSRDVSTPTGSTTRTVKPDGTHHDNTWKEHTKSGTVESTRSDQIDQRDKYLNSIRSLYAEFAEKFKPCFLDMYF